MTSNAEAAVLGRVGQIAINVHDVERATTFYMEGIELWMVSMADSEGNLLALMCEVKV